jgi:DNA-binding winged helix-turn-helix (wHTH) protein/serine/threonine protein kinase
MDPIGPTGHAQRSAGYFWRFGDCEFDERRRELRVRDIPVDIEVKPLEVLRQLLLHAGEVVTKAELLESVWRDVAVVDGSLATAISKVRKLLDDDGSIIVTVPRIGYKLAVPVYSEAVVPPDWPNLRLEPGLTVPGRDQWRLARRLDLSPAGEVWLAEHPKTRETRVFKFAADADHLRCLKREVTVARLLRESLGERPEFVRVLEWRFDLHPSFIESEYAGPNLAEWADAQGGIGSVPLDVRLKLLAETARAVAAAHGIDVLHKDLKPGNILVATSPDGTPQAKVADFGSASLLAPSRLSAFGITNLGFTQTQAGDKDPLTGTPIYVAPEVLAGQSPTAASDVYALGVLLYQLVVGDFSRPFAPGWEGDIADPFIREDIAAAASGDPSRRINSAAELAERVHNLDGRRLAEEEAHQRQRLELARQARAAARRRWIVYGAASAAAVAMLALLISRSTTPAPASVEPKPRIVGVLPFQNTGSDSAIDFLRFALADQIATVLSRSKGLAVRPFSTTSTYDQLGVDVQKAGKAIRADTLVTGRFEKVQDQLHITLEAIDVAANELLWRDTVKAPAQSLIATHVQMSLTVRGGLVPALGASVTDAVPEPRNDEAYELYLRSSMLLYDPGPNPQATAMLERAVELDPTYAPAWVSLGRRYYVEGHFGSGNPAMMSRAVAAAERAVALDPDDVNAAAALTAFSVERGDLATAHRRAADLVARQPDIVIVQFLMSYVLRYAGLLEEAGTHCDRALLIDPHPVDTLLRSCALVFSVRGDFARALNYVNLDRESETGKAYWVDMLARQGKTAAALEVGLPQVPQWRAKYEMLFACLQDRSPEEIVTLARGVQPAADSEENYHSAAHLSYCGQTEAAAGMLRRAIQGNYCSYPAMESDPLFANLRAKPEYGELRARGLACQERFLAERRDAGASLNRD